MSNQYWIFLFLVSWLIVSGVFLVMYFAPRIYPNNASKEKRKRTPEGKRKNDGVFVDMHGNEYEIIEDEYSGSIMPVRKSKPESLRIEPIDESLTKLRDKDISKTIIQLWDEQLSRRLSDQEMLARFPVEITDAQIAEEDDKPYLDELTPVYNFRKSQFDYYPEGHFSDDTLLVEMPVTVQDWDRFPRGAWINNLKHVGDIVQLMDGRWVQVEEVLENEDGLFDGKYRMRILPNYDKFLDKMNPVSNNKKG